MRWTAFLLCLFLSSTLQARSASDYLPADADLDPTIPPPEAILGADVAEWHVRHDQLRHYMEVLAETSDRVSLEVIGRSHENRPLLLMSITSSANQQNLDALREQHLENAREGKAEGPLVLWMGYSVHGDEASGSNAALLVAYYLAASRSEFVTRLLNESIVLLDPSLNPDGLDRFATWVNGNRGVTLVDDPANREHREPWPTGRVNHYWFDLNRDWLPLVHPESRARLTHFHRWLPHVLTDFHEQGSNAGYFFQPGVPERQNPLTPAANLELTQALAEFHAQALDRTGQIYFTQESFDDFYYGKGSTYPDINGSIGILYEQPTVAGHMIDTINGPVSFELAVENHLITSLSTLRGALSLKQRLLDYQASFFQSMQRRSLGAGFKAWVVGNDDDPARTRELLDVFDYHDIDYRLLDQEVSVGGYRFYPGQAWVIPAQQRQFGLLQAMMETRTQFEDSTFYDVSTWTLPLAHNLPYATLRQVPRSIAASPGRPVFTISDQAVAWAIPWNQYQAPRVLQQLLSEGLEVRVAEKSFSALTDNNQESFAPGTLLVIAGLQKDQTQAVALMRSAVTQGLDVYNITSMLTPQGPDLGSQYSRRVEAVKPLLLADDVANPYEVGEVWHYLDQEVGLGPVMINSEQLVGIDLDDYSHLIMVDGDYSGLPEAVTSKVVKWVSSGGIILATKGAAKWTEGLCYQQDPAQCEADDDSVEDSDDADEQKTESKSYASFSDDQAQRVIGGAIVNTLMDLTHPLSFGYQREALPVFLNGTQVLSASDNPYVTPLRYTEKPLLSGFIGTDRLDKLSSQPALIAERQGAGLVVRYGMNPLFRGFWRGTERLFVNGLYFGQTIGNTNLAP